MIKFFTKRVNNKKGFTLIKLIVVIAILGILAAIAIPRFSRIQDQAKIDEDVATAKSIVGSARTYDAQNNDTLSVINISQIVELMDVPTPKTGGIFAIGTDENGDYYTVTFGGGISLHTYYEETSSTTEP